MRLIDADALPRLTQIYEFNGKQMEIEIVYVKSIDNAPTIDAVPATIEGALSYLHKVGWMQEHDRIMTEDVAPVRHGRWEEIDDLDFDTLYRCSVCGEEFYLIDGTPRENQYYYCPCCGSKMDEEADDFCSMGERKDDDDQ